MKCPSTDCDNEVPEDAKAVNVIDPNTFETKRHLVCGACYEKIQKAQDALAEAAKDLHQTLPPT